MSVCSASFLRIIFNTSYVTAKAKKKTNFPAIVNRQNSSKWNCVFVAVSNLGSSVYAGALQGHCTSQTLSMATHMD